MEKLDVKFYQDIISVERSNNQAILTTWDSTTSKTIKHNCGFLIWSAPMTEFLRYMWVDNITTIFIYKSSFRVADTTELEAKYFNTLTPQYFIANLVDMQDAVCTGEFNVYLQDLNSTTGDRGTLHANVNYYKTFHPYECPKEQPKVESFSILQASRNKIGDQELKEKLRSELLFSNETFL